MIMIVLIMPFIFSITTAQEKFPSRPVTIINPLAPAGGVDIALRGLAKEMQTLLGQPVLVESRPGGGGTIAGEFIARSKPDGYTMGCFQSPQAMPELFTHWIKAPYTSVDLRPVVRYFYLCQSLGSKAPAPWKGLNEFVKYVQANPNTVRWGHTSGSGSPNYFLSFSFMKKSNLKLIEVPFKGAGEAIQAMLGGHIDVAYGCSVTSLLGHVQAGKLAILALHSPKRLTVVPEVPTFLETGLDPGLATPYNTFFVPKGTPEDVVKKIHDTVKAAIETPALQEYARKNVFELYYGSEKEIIEELRMDREVTVLLAEEIVKQEK
jgi:tripartite-type tricarboxylate transporter receptor subunit TctC